MLFRKLTQQKNTPQAPPKYPLSTPQVELLIQKTGDSYMSMREMAEGFTQLEKRPDVLKKRFGVLTKTP